MKSFFEEMEWRGLIHQKTSDIDSLSSKFAYIGFDLTADSLHVGSLVQIMVLRMMERHGLVPLILLGTATTKIGDPTEKDRIRPQLTDREIADNRKGIAKVFDQFSLGHVPMHDNHSWLGGTGYLDFLREVGPHVSVNKLLTLDSVKTRLAREQKLSFLELNYPLMQAYDFVQLANRYNCQLQIGGSDQWGNIVTGIDLGRKLCPTLPLHGLTTPLVTTANGTKMGKTASGAVWLSPDKLHPNEYYQFWRNCADSDVVRFLKMFTELSSSEIEEVVKLDINEGKKRLAFETTKICHGQLAAATAQESFRKPAQEIQIGENTRLFEAVVKTGRATSNSSARRLIEGGAVLLNGLKETDFNALVPIPSILTVSKRFVYRLVPSTPGQP